MQKVQSDIMTFKGSHYDLGVETGKWLKTTRLMQNREQEWKKRLPRFDIDINATHDIFNLYAPQIWEELMGMREVLALPMRQIIFNFAHYRFTPIKKDSGCTVFLGDDYLVRNYDYHPATYDGRYLLYAPNDGGLAQMGPTSRITGRMDGLNSAGLAMGYNFMHRKHPQDGFVCYMIGRLILELCENVDDAIRLLQEIPHRSSFSYIVMDKHLQHAIIEVTPRGVDIRYDRTCTNHFKLLTHENRNYTKESKERLARTLKQTDIHMDKMKAFELFNQPQYEIYSKLFSSWSGTIHTSMYQPDQMKAWIALGENGTPMCIDFAKWLNGDELDITKLHGEIDSTIQFASE